MAKVTHERLRELLAYDQETGEFTWRVARGPEVPAGSVAGMVNEDGYRIVTVDGSNYRAHVLAWFYMTGEWPTKQVDHKDNGRDNNRWENLREATNGENGANKGKQCNNTTGHKGVSFDAKRNRFRAVIYKDGKQTHLGYFITAQQASDAYVDAAPRFHGEFARTVSPLTEGQRVEA